jgi:hypothetical protein
MLFYSLTTSIHLDALLAREVAAAYFTGRVRPNIFMPRIGPDRLLDVVKHHSTAHPALVADDVCLSGRRACLALAPLISTVLKPARGENALQEQNKIKNTGNVFLTSTVTILR